MPTIRVPGVTDPRPEPSPLASGLPPGSVRVTRAVRVQAARAAGEVRLEGLADDDVIEIELADGLHLWSRVEDAERDFGLRRSRAAGDELEFPAELPTRDRSRGAGAWAIKALRIVGIDLEQKITAFAAGRVEGRLDPGPGLYRCDPGDAARLTRIRSIDASGPTLIFLHGTASSTSGSFGGLWTGKEAGAIQRLAGHYGGRVLALQHRSLTESPIENARALAQTLLELLGPGAELHLVSHSRGGLIGELLARSMRVGAAPFTRDDLALFAGRERARDRDALADLNQVLQRAKFTVSKFVRVACPARGTTLADGRLDRYFSVLVNLLGWAGLRDNPIYDGVTSLLAGVLKQRTKPEELPGLEAMMPASPLIGMLNRPDSRTAADLHVLGGDLEGAGLWGRLKTLATDLYYREDHDLVVNTPAMLGGTDRRGTIRYWIDAGPEVTHFNYFKRSETAGRLVAALTGGAAEFRELAVEPFAVSASDYRKRAVAAQPVAFVVPGIMGSALAVGGDDVWVSRFALATGGLSRLAMSAKAVEATGILRNGYDRFCEFLSFTHEVVPFPYDWRQSIVQAAAKLGAALEAKLTQTEAQQQPIRIVAHSMGGLVVRALLATKKGQEIWTRMGRQPGSRLIMLGTPNGGSHAIVAMIMGRDALVRQLALLDLTRDHAGLLETIASFDGVLDLLPHARDGALDCHDPATWTRLFEHDAPSARGLFGSSVAGAKAAGFVWSRPDRDRLRAARAVRDLIAGSPIDAGRMIYVAGVADETACDVAIDERAPEGRRVRVLATAHGDGRVTWATGLLPGVRTYYMDAVHGDMANEPRHFTALLDLLTTGATSKLDAAAPQRRSAATDLVELREPSPAMLPDAEEIAVTALGGRRRRERPAAERPRIAVRVVHDNLTNATAPVLVGHYQDDVIVAAEAYLDRTLGGRLSELQRMELYAGPPEKPVVVLNVEDGRRGRASHPGAIVAGLGRVGELSPGRLTNAIAEALTAYGAERVEGERRRRQRLRFEGGAGGFVSAPVTAVLVGSGDGGVTLADSVGCLLRAVTQANRRLANAQGPDGRAIVAEIDRLDILELYEDRAIEAVYALRALSKTAAGRDFVAADLLVQGAEGQRRPRYDTAADWWQRIRVVEKDGGLQFEALTQQARAHAVIRPDHKRTVEAFVSQASATTAADPRLASTLFELLVPNEFKIYAPDRRRLAIVLDSGAAALPWELLHDKYDSDARPLSVEGGMIRQLLTPAPPAPVSRAPSRTALVIGNPIVHDPRFPPLPGAEAEAGAVAAVLGANGYDTLPLLGLDADAVSILEALHERPWRILHLAAHGVFAFEHAAGAPPVTGLVMSDGLYFTPVEASQLRVVPELVFINCCYLGTTQGDVQFNRIAANLGTLFIQAGARAVVAAGWAVDDRAAKTFAVAFYEQLFGGRNFGDAVQRARAETFAQFGHTNTWGAYQCYGDPAFTIVKGASAVEAEPPAAPIEVIIRAEQIARQSRQASLADRRALHAELDQRTAAMPNDWWTQAEVAAAVGMAYGELDDFARAVACYERVRTSARATASLRSVEQLANLTSRLAVGLDDAAAARAQLDAAQRDIESLLAIGETAERLALLGSVHKRRALLARSAGTRRKALADMVAAYGRALDRAGGSPSARAYALSNQLAGRIVEAWRRRGASALAPIRRDLAALQALAAELQESTQFFDLAASADCRLLEALAAGALRDQERTDIEAAYTAAGWRGISPRERLSMLDQHRFFAAMARGELAAPRGERLAGQLEGLIDTLEKN